MYLHFTVNSLAAWCVTDAHYMKLFRKLIFISFSPLFCCVYFFFVGEHQMIHNFNIMGTNWRTKSS